MSQMVQEVTLAMPEPGEQIVEQEAVKNDVATKDLLVPENVDTEESFIVAREVFDRDGNGFISIGKFRHVITNWDVELMDEEGEMFQVAEGDVKGKK